MYESWNEEASGIGTFLVKNKNDGKQKTKMCIDFYGAILYEYMISAFTSVWRKNAYTFTHFR